MNELQEAIADRWLAHKGHRLDVGAYGTPIVNVAIECMDCYEVLTDTDSIP